MNLVTLCGSLRANSSNRALLLAYERLALSIFEVHHFEQLGELPHFNPDLDGERSAPVVGAFRSLISNADAVLISTPEYAHGLPGSFKNALDWLVSDPSFAGKLVAILHVPRGSTWALDSLREVLRTMSARVVEAASVSLPLGTNQVDANAILADANLRRLLLLSIEKLRSYGEVEPLNPNQAVEGLAKRGR